MDSDADERASAAEYDALQYHPADWPAHDEGASKAEFGKWCNALRTAVRAASWGAAVPAEALSDDGREETPAQSPRASDYSDDFAPAATPALLTVADLGDWSGAADDAAPALPPLKKKPLALRVTTTADHGEADVKGLVAALAKASAKASSA